MANFDVLAPFQWSWRICLSIFRFLRCVISRCFTKTAGFVYSLFKGRNGYGSQKDRDFDNGNDPSLKRRVEEAEAAPGSFQQPGCEVRSEITESGFDSEEYRVDPADELYCGYDSTWETEPERQQSQFRKTRRPRASSYKFRRFEVAAKDMQNYRHDYPLQIRQQSWNPVSPCNLEFYLGNRPSSPDNMYIHNFHKDWYGDYDKLESVHTYIQWLFPLQEPGVNSDASTLTKEEIKDFCENSTAMTNLLKSYKLMLDFYGITLCDENTGEVTRASNWSDRFNNLNSHTHNSLRITRILKCLGNLGYTHYQYPLVYFFLKETLINGELPCVKDSVLNYFVFAVLDKSQRRSLIKFAYLNYEPKDEFVWCPKKIQMMWSSLYELRQQEGFNVRQDADSQH